MSVIFPNEEIAARWKGALEARVRQAPLEHFLRSRGQKWVRTGDAGVTDNLACGAIYLLDGALNACMLECRTTLSLAQHPAVGQMACAVSHGLATLIQEPNTWRIVALVSTARVLAPYSGLAAAAHLAAAAARDYSSALNSGTRMADLVRIGDAAGAAVGSNDEAGALHVMKLMSRSLKEASRDSRPPCLTYDLAGAGCKSSSP